MSSAVGFVGGGRVAAIILGGWARAGKMPRRIVVTDPSAEAIQRLREHLPTVEIALGESRLTAAQDTVFLAVHPPVAREVLPEIGPALRPDAILVSLLPKWTIAKLSEALGGFRRIVRMIPNAPSIIGAGHNPLAFSEVLSDQDRASVLDLVRPLGESPEVAEDKLEAFAVLTGMGPTYLWFQLYELLDIARSLGLAHDEATRATLAMVIGTARVMAESGLPPERVMDLIPVQPLKAEEESLKEAYRSKLVALHQKIRP